MADLYDDAQGPDHVWPRRSISAHGTQPPDWVDGDERGWRHCERHGDTLDLYGLIHIVGYRFWHPQRRFTVEVHLLAGTDHDVVLERWRTRGTLRNEELTVANGLLAIKIRMVVLRYLGFEGCATIASSVILERDTGDVVALQPLCP